ncbi:hypothetical protein EZV62_002448 [Acer yangbiense]|uniref:Uncharacterized protein n=1 Tax=Acer yangbiense TaxID=1000413 RepID=A0A5C7IXM7_9ROSI|nr:hypothetical protein EZV62_002448 [Acer yangbiense]
MVSSKKTREEKEKKKTKETKLTKPEIKNKKKPSPKKPKNNNNNKTINGAAKKEPEVVTTPSSSADSHQEPESQESEKEQEKRSEEATNQRNKSKKSKKGRENQEEVDDEDVEKACRFPTKRIWRIVKSQSSGSSITGDAVFLVNKATVFSSVLFCSHFWFIFFLFLFIEFSALLCFSLSYHCLGWLQEKFLEQFCEDAHAQCVKDRKKSLSYQHLGNLSFYKASVVSKQRRYDFLSDFVPEKIKAEAALAESKLTEKEEGYES